MNKVKSRYLLSGALAAFSMLLVPGYSNASVFQTDQVKLQPADYIPLIAIGAITASSPENSLITINGQQIVIDGATETITLNGNFIGKAGFAEIPLNSYAAVGGDVMDAGRSLATIILILEDEYIPGISTAYSRVIVGANDASVGGLVSGDSSVNYVDTLAGDNLSNANVGDLVEVFGLAYGSLLVATESYFVASESDIGSLAIRGSGVRAIRGSGVRAIRGSGVRAIRGSGVRAIRGSGVRAIRGSGVRAIRGSGVR